MSKVAKKNNLVQLVLKLLTILAVIGNKAIAFETKLSYKIKLLLLLLLVGGSIVAAVIFLQDKNLAILHPQGYIASKQLRLLVIASVLSLFIVIPVFAMTLYIAITYRASNKAAVYKPDFDHSVKAETIWWVLPMILIVILSVITWQSSHDLDPYKTIAGSKKPLKIQVIALDWKWLFIYPDEHIATVNYVQLPVNTPVDFEITSDAPMNSFWVPQLGGQIYAMSGMSTHLNVLATKEGDYAGSSANISGKGFAGMKFTVHVTSSPQFYDWAAQVHDSYTDLDDTAYAALAQQCENHKITYYSAHNKSLYDKVVMKYMSPTHSTHTHNHTHTMESH